MLCLHGSRLWSRPFGDVGFHINELKKIDSLANLNSIKTSLVCINVIV